MRSMGREPIKRGTRDAERKQDVNNSKLEMYVCISTFSIWSLILVQFLDIVQGNHCKAQILVNQDLTA